MMFRQIEKSSAHLLMEPEGLAIQSIHFGGGSPSRQPGRHGEIEHQRQVRGERLGGKAVQSFERGDV
jgi:hypothetical protein